MKRTISIRATALLLVVVALVALATTGSAKRDSAVPIVFSITPSTVLPGSNVSIEVQMSRASSADQVVTISTATWANWSSLPSKVTVPAGHTTITFPASISMNASGCVTGTASCNGSYVSSVAPIMGR